MEPALISPPTCVICGAVFNAKQGADEHTMDFWPSCEHGTIEALGSAAAPGMRRNRRGRNPRA